MWQFNLGARAIQMSWHFSSPIDNSLIQTRRDFSTTFEFSKNFCERKSLSATIFPGRSAHSRPDRHLPCQHTEVKFPSPIVQWQCPLHRRNRAIVLFVVWFSVSTSYYGITYYVPNLSGDRWTIEMKLLKKKEFLVVYYQNQSKDTWTSSWEAASSWRLTFWPLSSLEGWYWEIFQGLGFIYISSRWGRRLPLATYLATRWLSKVPD